MSTYRFGFLLMTAAVSLTGCFPKVEEIKAAATPGPVFPALPDARQTYVGLAVSGGGSRAASFAAGAMEALTTLPAPGSASLMEQVSHISSVSGGSLASAYYAMKRPDKGTPVLSGGALTPAYSDFFSTFHGAMQANYEGPAAVRQTLKLRAFNSTKMAYTLSELWDEAFFHELKFADLYARETRGDAPRLILNGTRWNDGRRFVFTTLPLVDFSPSFANGLLQTLNDSAKVPAQDKVALKRDLGKAYGQFRPVSFEDPGDKRSGDFGDLRIALAVAGSASVPALIGPVTFHIGGAGAYQHVGDGGLFDNQGVESLAEIFLHKLIDGTGLTAGKRALIIMIDASYPFDAAKAELDAADKPLDVLAVDPFRIQGMMEQRALAYQLALWSVLRAQQVDFVPSFETLRIVHLRHTDAIWQGYAELPAACRDQVKPDASSAQINAYIASISTRFKLEHPCHGPLLIAAAHKIVKQNEERIVGFLK